MNRFSIIIFAIFLSIPSLFAQPVNDECITAIELTDTSNDCQFYEYDGSTFNLYNGFCASFLEPNVWFKFIATGTDIDVSIQNINNINGTISLVEFDQNLCELESVSPLVCEVNEISEETILTIGNTYYLIVQFPQPLNGDFLMCIDVPFINMDPPNDNQCFASFLLPGGCKDGTTIGATTDFGNPDCVIAAENTIWYETFINPGNNTLTITMDNADQDSITGDIAFMLVEFANNDCHNLFNVIDNSTYCGGPDFTIDIPGLSPTKTYYIQIITEAEHAGNFTICASESAPPPGCAENDLCIKAFDISVGLDSTHCTTGCTIGASDGPTNIIGSCFYMANPTVWYSYIPSQRPSFVGIELHSDSLSVLQLAIYAGDGCDNLQPIYCEYGVNGELYYELDTVLINKTYYFAISEATGKEGVFDICVTNFTLDVSCNIGNELIVTNTSFGSPHSGPFQSGEKVTFCYQITDWLNENCNWLQGISPTFGTGWDPSSYGTNGVPKVVTKWPQAYSGGEWKWFGNGDVTYNVDNPHKDLYAGDPAPGGWYFVKNGIEDPDDSLGDGINCNLESGLAWEVCFTMTALSFPTCEALPPYGSGSVVMTTFSDSEVGSNDLIGCLEDVSKYFESDIVCCPNPVIQDTAYIVCFGEDAIIPLNPDPNNSIDYTWEVIPNPKVSGYYAGSGDTINQILVNHSSKAESITYVVYPQDTTGCLGSPGEIEVRVVPAIYANAGTDRSTCANNEISIGGNPTGDGGASLLLFYEWAPGGYTTPNPTVTPAVTTTYSVTVTDVEGCTAIDDLEVAVTPQPHAQMFGSDAICDDGTGFITIEFTGESPFTYFIYEEGVISNLMQTNESTVNLPFAPETNSLYQIASFHDANCEGTFDGFATIQVFNNTSATISEEICFGDVYEINGKEYSESGTYTENLIGQNSVGCDSIVTLNLTVLPKINIQNIEIIPDNGTGNGSISFSLSGGSPPFTLNWNDTITSPIELVAGRYFLNVVDDNGCEANFTFDVPLNTNTSFIEDQAIRFYPNPVKMNTPMYFESDNKAQISDLKIIGVDGKTRLITEDELFSDGQKNWIYPKESGLHILVYTINGKQKMFKKIVVLE